MKLKLLAAVAIALACVGCASVDVTKTLPSKPFVELGTVTASGFGADESAVMHNEIRAKSAALGANAAVIQHEGFIPGAGGPKKWATGVAIRYYK